MKFKFLNQFLIGLSLVLASTANAGLITVDNWHLTTDQLGGLRQSSASDEVFYAVSKITTLDWSNTFETIQGYHFATYQEWRDLSGPQGGPNREYGYYNQGGWNGYIWENTTRYWFLFADSQQTGWYKHAGNYDTTANQASLNNGWGNIAGFVMVKDKVTANPTLDVPEPSTLAIFALGMISLAARRFKK